MIWRQFQILLQRRKTTTHLHQLYSLFLKSSLDHDHFSVSRFILSSCSLSIEFSRSIFDKLPITPPLFAWSTIIREYSNSTIPVESLNLFLRLRKLGLSPDKFTYPFVLKACGLCSMVGFGGSVHSSILKSGFDSDKYIGNTMITMYSSCGAVRLARQVFDEMGERDVVSWSSMIAGYVNCSYPLDAFRFFQLMKSTDENPNSVTLVSLLSACVSLLNISIGESIHSYTIVNNIRLDTPLGTALVELYSKCGKIEEAIHVFNSLNEKNLKSWTIMISGLADNGRGEDAITLFTQMERTGMKPDSMLFSSVLSACSHMGLVKEGKRYFQKMVGVYNLKPTIEHYGCIIDMLGRAGLIEEAYGVLKNMSIEPNSIVLRSFIGACNKYCYIVPSEENQKNRLLEIEPDVGANYVVAAGISSLSENWFDAASLRVAMKCRGLRKVPGLSLV